MTASFELPLFRTLALRLYLIWMWKKIEPEYHIYHLRAHAIIIKWKKKKNETHELGTITKHALLHIQIYNYRLHISNVSHFEHVQYAYITHQSIGRGNATFYRINNIGHKADGWNTSPMFVSLLKVSYTVESARANSTLTPWAQFIIKSTLFDSVSFWLGGEENSTFFFQSHH